jgi:uncharacterized protein (DUF58 family)
MKGSNSNTGERTREILRRVRQVEIKTNRLVTDTLSGQYHSAFRGQGMNFEEVREYHPGDEVRNIDWNVTARTGRPFVKKFIEERELTIMLLIDVSASGHFGSGQQSKRDLAAELGSMFAFSAIRNRDKVGLMLFSDKAEHYLPPRKGNNHVLRVIRDILYFEPEGKGTDICAALDRCNQLLHHKAVIILISDFCLPDPYPAQMDRLIRKMDVTNHKHDLIALAIQDPIEKQLPQAGLLALEDSESGQQVWVDTRNPKVRDAYQRLNEERMANLRTRFAKRGIDHIELQTNEPYLKEVYRFFKGRNRRRI